MPSALRLEESWGAPTVLREMLLAATASENANQMLHRFYTDEWPRPRVAALARLVDLAAAQSDAVALGILRDGGVCFVLVSCDPARSPVPGPTPFYLPIRYTQSYSVSVGRGDFL